MALRARVHAEIRIIGWHTVLAPLLLSGSLLAVQSALQALPGTHALCVFLGWLVVQGFLPLLLGLLTAGQVAQETAGDLPFTWLAPYGHTALLRFVLTLVVGVLASGSAFGVLAAMHLWPATTPLAATDPLVGCAECIGCLLALWGCAAGGWGIAVLMHSPTASRVMLALLWLASLAASAGSTSVIRWLWVQGGWFVIGCLALLVGWSCLRRPEWTFQRMEELI